MFSGLLLATGHKQDPGQNFTEEPMFQAARRAAWLIAAGLLLSAVSFAQPRDKDDDDHWKRDYHVDNRDHDRDHGRRNDHDRDDWRRNDHDRDDWRRDRDHDSGRWHDNDRDRRWDYRRDGYYRRDVYRYPATSYPVYGNSYPVYPSYPNGGYSYPTYPNGGYGYPSGGYGYPSGGYGYPNGGSGYPVYRTGSWGGYGQNNNTPYNFGYQDGAMVARQDMAEGKPYHPDPRGKYEDEDHGYYSGWGDKSYYRSVYANGYRAGYMSASRRRY